MDGSFASVHCKAEDNFLFSLIQASSEQLQDQKKFSNLERHGLESSNGEDFEYRQTWLGALIWLQWEWEDGTAWDYHNWNKGEIAICIWLFLNQILEFEIWKNKFQPNITAVVQETSIMQERDLVTLVCASSWGTTLVTMRPRSGPTSIVFAKDHVDAIE